VDWEHTTKRVLTTEWINGCHATETNCLISEGLPLPEVAHKITLAFSEQIFSTGFIHGDPHPGNILVRKSFKDGSVEICLLDHGLYTPLRDE
jgi:aarF domain-containing kinase